MQVSKLIVALTVVAGFATSSFAQGAATPATPAATGNQGSSCHTGCGEEG